MAWVQVRQFPEHQTCRHQAQRNSDQQGKHAAVGKANKQFRSGQRITAQAQRELLQLANTRTLGTLAPVLQLPDQLLALGIGSFPQGHQFCAQGISRM